jgi:SAM-dependent methyltransferase
MADERERLRTMFDGDAERYDRARPGYPPALFDQLPRDARVLEIGCGTGQATRSLAERGCRVTAVELGAELAAVARRNLAGHPGVEVVTAAFEEWPLPAEPFDLVLAATSFHWIDPAVRVAKSAAALRPGGALATVFTHHVAGGTSAFFAAMQDCYQRFDPATPPDLQMHTADEIPTDPEELPGFQPPTFHRYEWEQEYTTAAYLDLLLTYSGHRALPPAPRAGLLDCIGRLIDGQHGGRVVKRYLTELRFARVAT